MKVGDLVMVVSNNEPGWEDNCTGLEPWMSGFDCMYTPVLVTGLVTTQHADGSNYCLEYLKVLHDGEIKIIRPHYTEVINESR